MPYYRLSSQLYHVEKGLEDKLEQAVRACLYTELGIMSTNIVAFEVRGEHIDG
jgi:hypothetical protein